MSDPVSAVAEAVAKSAELVKEIFVAGKELATWMVGDQGKLSGGEGEFEVDIEKLNLSEEIKVTKTKHTAEFAFMKKAGAAVSLGRRLSGDVPEYANSTKDVLLKNKTYKQFRFMSPIRFDWTVATLTDDSDSVSFISHWRSSDGSAVTPHNNWNEEASLKFDVKDVEVAAGGVLLEVGWHFETPGRGHNPVCSAVERVGLLKFSDDDAISSEGAGAENMKQM